MSIITLCFSWILLASSLSFAGPSPQVCNNELLRSSDDTDPIRFDRISNSHFRPAFVRALRESQRRLDQIRNNPESPTFENTILALEQVGVPLELVSSVFHTFLSVQSDPSLEVLAERMSPRLSRFESRIYFDRKIFERVRRLYRNDERIRYTAAQKTLIEDYYKRFATNGIELAPNLQSRLAEIDQKLSLLQHRFRANLTSDTKNVLLIVRNPAELAGIPQDHIDAAAALAFKTGHSQADGSEATAWAFTQRAATYRAVMTNGSHRGLRERFWRAFSQQGSRTGHDNRPLLREIVNLRQERARLLGFQNYAQSVLSTRMAQTPQAVQRFLEELANHYRPRALEDLADIERRAGHSIEPWDLAYYSTLIKQERFHLRDDDLRPYFALDKVIDGALYAAGRLFDVEFIEKRELPRWHSTVKVYSVKNKNGSHLGYFYIDPYSRDSKRSGAWMSDLLQAGNIDGVWREPHVINCMNFSQPKGEAPTLLTMSEVTTVFHELGHAMHSLLTRVPYRSLAGTNVPLDFVEFPSQFFENWATVPDVIEYYARHYQTGEPIPRDLLRKVEATENLHRGLEGLRRVSASIIDLAWHTHDVSSLHSQEELLNFERQVLAPYRLLPSYDLFFSASFAHIFAGGYASGYYSYLWADVLAADGFEVFEQTGYFDASLSLSLRAHIHEKGGSETAAVLYQRFRGRMPNVQALLLREGLGGANK